MERYYSLPPYIIDERKAIWEINIDQVYRFDKFIKNVGNDTIYRYIRYFKFVGYR